MDLGLLGAVVKIAGALILGVPLAAYLLQDKLIFHPRPVGEAERKTVAARHPAVAEIFLQAADGTRLHAWHYKAAPGSPLVLYFGGNAEEVSWMLDELPRQPSGVAWLLTDYRGYGASGGAPSEASLVADARAWYDAMAKDYARVFAFGRSLGSGVAVRLASERRLDGVILVAPFDSLVQVGKRHYPFLPVNLLLRHRFDSLTLAPKIVVPLVCIAATDDDIIPAEHARRLYDAWGGPKRWVGIAGGHNTIDDQPDYWPSIRVFVAGR